jgi:hypothetical protein
MARVIVKKDQHDFVVTSSQSGGLYVSGLPVEKILFAGSRRKLKTIEAAFAEIYPIERSVQVNCGSCLETGLPDEVLTMCLQIHRLLATSRRPKLILSSRHGWERARIRATRSPLVVLKAKTPVTMNCF